MKGDKIIDALGKIDDRLVTAAIPAPREHKRSVWPVLLAAAAVIALCIFAVPQALQRFAPDNPDIPHQTTDPDPDVEKVLRHLHLPTLSHDFPATVSEAEDRGIVLQTLAQWGELGALLPVYEVTPELPVVGEYPCWTPEQAMDRLMEGYGYCNMEEPIPEPLIYELGLVYLEFEDTNDDYIPYYWFSVKLGTGEEGLYFLPAVHDKYLYCVTWWKERAYDTIEEKLRMTPDNDGISFEVRDAFAAFLRGQGLEEKYLDYHLQLSKKQVAGEGEVAVLSCNGPLMVVGGDSQNFHYHYADGTVTWGASGEWHPQGDHPADAVRRILLYRDAEDAGGEAAYEQQVRQAFALYFLHKKYVMEYLPEFDSHTQPDRDDLLLYAVLMGSRKGPGLTKEELEAVVAEFLEGVTVTHGSGKDIRYLQDRYTYRTDFILSENPVYYRPEKCTWNPEDNTCTLVVSGYEFWKEDLLEQTEERSPNWQALEAWLEENTKFGRAFMLESLESAVLDFLYDKFPEDIGMKASERITVTFHLQEGNNPMRFVSCEREILS